MKKILLLDDDIDILNVIKLVLSYKRYEVKAISKWQNVQAILKEFSPDLIMLDIDLGGADGGEICKKIKLSKKNQHIPVILISAHHLPEKYLKSVKAQGFVSKPFEMQDLLNIVKHNLN